VQDPDTVASMLTAMLEVISVKNEWDRDALNSLKIGELSVLIEHGPKVMLVALIRGTEPSELRVVFRSTLDRLHETLAPQLGASRFNDISIFEPARPLLEQCLLGTFTPRRRKQFVPAILLTAVVVLLAVLGFQRFRTQQRWDAYLEKLREEPGFVVVRAERHGSGGFIQGLRDPLSADPEVLLKPFELDPNQVRFEFQSYHSADSRFSADRELRTDVEHIQMQTIRFEVGDDRLLLSQAGILEDVATSMDRVRRARPAARITITGHTDSLSSLEAKPGLSANRARSVSSALTAQGIPPSFVRVVDAGSSKTLRGGKSEWDQAANRSVSFHVDRN
jgi:outer membrane protein OmpA-like peptidoglycan-associated protein